MPERPRHLDDLLTRHLQAFLGDADPALVEALRRHLRWVEAAAGDTLMRQGEPGDAMYLLVSGRLRASVADAGGHQRVVREITRGQVVGEMSLYTDAPRSATLVALRDSVLVRLDKPDFHRLLARSGLVSIAMTRQIIQRLQSEGAAATPDRPAAIALLPVSPGIVLGDWARRLARQLCRHGRVAVVDAATLEAQLGTPGISHCDAGDAEANRRIAVRLDQIEAEHDLVLLVGDDTPSPWTRRCSRHCDELLLLADATQPAQLHAVETGCLMQRPARTDVAEVLVLLQPAARLAPQHTQQWLRRRPLAAHVHLREGHEADLARLARLLTRQATGLVLAGGGARGAAHAGVYRALVERGVEIDVVGGTSMGAVFGAAIAHDVPPQTLDETFRANFAHRPTGDVNLLPMISLFKGRRLRAIMERTALRFAGSTEAGVEDLWKSFYCVVSNVSQAREQVLHQGPLVPALMATCAVPGALPPVLLDDDLLCDGGNFNNFPVDVMRRQWGVGRVIGVDLAVARDRRPATLPMTELPGTWALLRDRLRPASRRRYALPSLANYLMLVTTLYSQARQRESRRLTDLYFRPQLPRIGMLQWDRYDETLQMGYEHACRVLDGDAPTPHPGPGVA